MLTGAQCKLRDPSRLGKRMNASSQPFMPQEYGRRHQICYGLMASQPADLYVHDWKQCRSVTELRVLTLDKQELWRLVSTLPAFSAMANCPISHLRLSLVVPLSFLCPGSPHIDRIADVMDDRCRWNNQGFEPLRQHTLI